MNRFLRFGLPLLWLLAYVAGVPGPITTALLLAAITAWLWPMFRQSKASGSTSAPHNPNDSPLASSFNTTPSPDAGWTRFTVYPARGKGPVTTAPGFIGAAGAAVAVVWLVGHRFPYNATDAQEMLLLLVAVAAFLAANWLIHSPYLRSYRRMTAAPNRFDVSPAGIRIGGHTLARASVLKLRVQNPITHASTFSSGVAAGGTGVAGAAAALGATIGSGVAQAAVVQASHLHARTAQHAWLVEALDAQGRVHRLAGGLTADTVEALLHAIETNLRS